MASLRAPGLVRKRAIELVVLGTPGLDSLLLALGAAAAGAGDAPIGGMPGGRTGKLGGVACAGVLDAAVASARAGAVLGAGGGRNGVDGGYDFLRTGWGGASLTWYTRS